MRSLFFAGKPAPQGWAAAPTFYPSVQGPISDYRQALCTDYTGLSDAVQVGLQMLCLKLSMVGLPFDQILFRQCAQQAGGL